MSVRTDQVNLQVIIGGNAAQAELGNLRKKAADIKFEMQGLVKGTKEFVAKNAELKEVNASMAELKKTIGLTSLNEKELNKELKTLKSLKGSVEPFSKEFNDLQKQIAAVEKRLYDVKNGVQGFSSFMSKVSGEIKQFGVVAAGYLGFQFITTQISNIISRSAKLSDQLADLQRVTSLTGAETKTLNAELGKLDTRTSTEGLRQIAIIAGKLGVAKNDILGFTAATDKLVVALGDELGDADQITTQLGKILNVFEGGVNGDNITKLGNALVDLANKGVASAGFMVDFTQRLSGIAKAANFSEASLLGLGAGLEENGAKVESSSTAISKLITNIGTDLPGAAKVAGVDLATFQKLFAEKPQEALLQYAAGLQKNKTSFAEVASSFKDAGEEGARVISTLSILGQKTDFFRGKMDEAAVAIKGTTEIENAFNLKNQTFGAELDKLGKNINRWFVNSAFSSFLQSAAEGLNYLLTPTKDAIQKFDELSKKVNNLDQNIAPLVDRYDELKKKTNLSTAEQAEMKTIIAQVTAVMPGAVTQMDEYGNAIAISTSRVREFISAEKDRLRVVNKNAIEENKQLLKESADAIEKHAQIVKEIETRGFFTVTETGSNGTGGGSVTTRKSTQDEIAAELDKQQQLLSNYNGYLGEINRLNGTDLENWNKKEDDKKDAAKSTTNEVVKSYEVDIAKLKEKIKIIDDQLKDFQGSQKQYNALLAQRKDLQKQLDSIEGKETKESSGERKLDTLMKNALQFKREIAQLKIDLDSKDSSQLEKQINAAGEKYGKLITQAQNYYNELSKLHGVEAESLKKAFAGYIKDLGLIQDQETGAILKAYAKTLPNQAYQEQKGNINKKYDGADQKANSDYVNNQINDTQRLAILQQNEIDRLQEIVDLTQMMGKDSTMASDEAIAALEKLTAAQVSKKKQDEKDEVDEGKAIVKKQVQEDKEKKKRWKDLTKEEKKNAKERVQIWQNAGDAVVNFYKGIDSIITALEQRRLQQSLDHYNKEKTELDKQLKHKLISQEQYEKRLQELNDARDKQQAELSLKQAKRQKVLNIFESLVGTAAAVVGALGAKPWGPWNYAYAATVGLAGLAETAAIAATPLPTAGQGGFLKRGPRHKDKQKGLHVVDPNTGITEALFEKDEAIIVAKAMQTNDQMTISGTPKQIASAINERYGGVSFDSGANIMPRYSPRINTDAVIKSFGAGGPYTSTVSSSGTSNQTYSDNLTLSLITEVKGLRADIGNWKSTLKAEFVYRDFKYSEQLLDLSQKASALQQ